MEQKPKLKAFNLEEALKDVTKVRTRYYKQVSELHKFNAITSQYKVIGIVNGDSFSFTQNGEFSDSESCLDLFLIDETPVLETYHNVYDDMVLRGHDSLNNAKVNSGIDPKKVIKLTISGDDVSAEIVHTY